MEAQQVGAAEQFGSTGTTGGISDSFAAEGGGGAFDAANMRKGKGKGKERKAEETIEETTTIESLPDELLLVVLLLLVGKTLMISVPQVCKRWRKLCPEIKNVHFDFIRWLGIM